MGLMGKSKKIATSIHEIPGKGCSVLVKEFVAAGSYLCEYESKEVYPWAKRAEMECKYSTD